MSLISDNLLQQNNLLIFLENSLICSLIKINACCRIYFTFDDVNLFMHMNMYRLQYNMYINRVLLDKVSRPPLSIDL